MVFLHIDMTQVVEILHHVRRDLSNLLFYMADIMAAGGTRSQSSGNHNIYYVEPD